eukprot:jgi/Mesvir1/29452/Mv23028-RA.1
MMCERSLLNRADGSARWSQDLSCVLVAVYGPRSIPPNKANSERALLEVIVKPKAGVGGAPEREMEYVLQECLEHAILSKMHPNCLISIIVQMVHDDGAALSCAINAASMALVDAGIPVRCMLASVTCVLSLPHVDPSSYGYPAAPSPDSLRLMIDPTAAEEQDAKSRICLCFPSVGPDETAAALASGPEDAAKKPRKEAPGVVTSLTSGMMTVEEYMSALALGAAACKSICAFFHKSLEQSQAPLE